MMPWQAPTDAVETTVKELLSVAPAGWVLLRCEFDPTAPKPMTATVTTAVGELVALQVSGKILSLLGEQYHRDANAGWPWKRLIIELPADGELSVRTDTGAGP